MVLGDERAAVWRRAVERAAALPSASRAPNAGAPSWDAVAVRRIGAIVLYALAVRDGAEPSWGQAAYHLQDANRVRTLAHDLEIVGDASLLDTDDPKERDLDPLADSELGPVRVWRWLTRTWNPEHDPDGPPRWDGLPRGIARALPDPALEVCTTPWTYNAALRLLARERDAWQPGTPVTVIAGPNDGATGTVVEPAWQADDTAQSLAPGNGVPGYAVACTDGPTRYLPTAELRQADAAVGSGGGTASAEDTEPGDRPSLTQAAVIVGITLADHHRTARLRPDPWQHLEATETQKDASVGQVGYVLAAALRTAILQDSPGPDTDADPDAVAYARIKTIAEVFKDRGRLYEAAATTPWPDHVQVLADAAADLRRIHHGDPARWDLLADTAQHVLLDLWSLAGRGTDVATALRDADTLVLGELWGRLNLPT